AVDAPRLGPAVGGVLRFTGADEGGVLVRVIGPMAGYLAAYRWAAAVGHALGRTLPRPDGEALAARVAAALADPTVPPIDTTSLAFVTSGAYGELAMNLQYKVLEGMLRPLPPVWDVL